MNDKDLNPLEVAKVYASYGRHEQARRVLEQAIEEFPARSDLQEALANLRSDTQQKTRMSSRAKVSVFLLLILGATLMFFGRYL